MNPDLDAWLEPPDRRNPEVGECECGGLDPDCLECNGEGVVELQGCDTCGSARCHCDDDYEAWKESQMDY